jgi:DNA helicase HerA-like ATPase
LPILGEGEALLVGVDFPMPLLVKIGIPNKTPKSNTPRLKTKIFK